MSSPAASSPSVAARMSRQASRDTAQELAVRRLLFRWGLRYRVNAKVPGLPRRTVDILFPGPKVAVFLDGCFWHGCPEHATSPKSNAEWWRTKLDRNVSRDQDTTRHLAEDGWTVLRFWEHEPPAAIARTVWTRLRPDVPLPDTAADAAVPGDAP
ncbi:very short patch repair endonuclease [Kitasatospora purpeofusca]|uniref:very short patch repair endonuclease n=1 Tax=Kitasatospora purpeofusca TaxID=67352 RepID=UPI003815AF74